MCEVIVVDDNRDLADDLAEILNAEGHHAEVAYNGVAALEVAATFAFDTALVDIRMPDMDGVALVRRLMGDRPNASYLFMTGYAADRSLAEAMAMSQRAVLYKPLDVDQLLRLVGRPRSGLSNG